uniref:hypothetical protein n=1 Tax=Marinobacterium profundum TaxID=1714300 RepID=UPI0008373290|nr:hypothetical protein [Marinobacterium profundum]
MSRLSSAQILAIAGVMSNAAPAFEVHLEPLKYGARTRRKSKPRRAFWGHSSKYRPRNETGDCLAAARRRRQMGIDDSCDYAQAN